MDKAVFIDRDGVINANREDYVKSWEEFEFLPGSWEAIRQVNEAGLKAIVVSNQSAVGRGIITQEDLQSIHEKMVEELSRHGAKVDGIYFCPHTPEAGCLCRKPRTGMFEKAAHRLGLLLQGSYLIGDAECDMRAGRKIMSTTVLVRTGRGREVDLTDTHYCPDHIAEDLPHAVAYILEKEHNRSHAK